MKIRIEPVTECDREWIHTYLQEKWGESRIVSRGVIYQADTLPGFIAYWQAEPAGLVTYHIEGAACEIVTLNSDIEGMGIGTALLEAVRKCALSRKCMRLWLTTTNDHTGALRFYQKRGYELVAIHRHAIEHSRKLKPSIPEFGNHGIPIRDEIELEMMLRS